MKKVSSSAIFRDFYTENYIYVDKTEAIYNLLSNNKKISLKKVLSLILKIPGFMISGMRRPILFCVLIFFILQRMT